MDQRGTIASLDGQQLLTRWQRLAPRSHPGATEADSWVLSDDARQDLRDQVVYNADNITQLRRLLDATAWLPDLRRRRHDLAVRGGA